MKIGEWYVVFDEKGRARGFGLSEDGGWFNTWCSWMPDECSWMPDGGHVVFTARMKKRGWKSEKVEIRRAG